MKKSILISGSSGHLGEALVRILKNRDHKIIGIDILPSACTDIVGNLTDRPLIKKIMQGVDVVMHTATLHKPHVVTHSKQDFVDTNITGTLNLLEEAKAAGVESVIFTSTTSTFGDAMKPAPNSPAIWITEEVTPIPKNIYGVTKTAAEDLCQLFSRNHQLPCIILRTSRFFKEEDDNSVFRNNYADLNIKANEFLHRRADIYDIVSAHICAMEKAKEINFGKYIISATTPFTKNDLVGLQINAHDVVKNIFPEYEYLYKNKDWKMFPKIGRVYDNEKARKELGWQPKYDFQYVLNCLKENKVFWSPLALKVGKKGYHEETFEGGPYPV